MRATRPWVPTVEGINRRTRSRRDGSDHHSLRQRERRDDPRVPVTTTTMMPVRMPQIAMPSRVTKAILKATPPAPSSSFVRTARAADAGATSRGETALAGTVGAAVRSVLTLPSSVALLGVVRGGSDVSRTALVGMVSDVSRGTGGADTGEALPPACMVADGAAL